MDPLIISGGLKLIGGLLGARSAKKARAIDAYNNSPQGIRANAEAAGFNPLVFAGPGVGTGATYAPQMGSIIANAFAGAADEVGKMRELEIANQQLELERDRLQQAVEQSTLQPNVGGIYSGRVSNTPEPNSPEPNAQTEIPPMMVPVEAPDGTTVMIGNQEAGIENPEWIAGGEFIRQNPGYLIVPALGGAGAYIGYRALNEGINRITTPRPPVTLESMAAERTRNAVANAQGPTRRGLGGGGGGQFRVPNQNRRGPYYPPMFSFF